MVGFFDGRFLLTSALCCLLIFVNGWTDAPNAVATAIGSGAIEEKKAIRLSAVCNLLGVLLAYAVNDTLSQNIIDSVSLGDNKIAALCSAMLSVVFFSLFAMFFGIPTSEGHALMAALSGAAAAEGQEIRLGFWGSVGLGIVLTTAAGFLLGFFFYKIIENKKINPRVLRWGQVLSAALLSLMHGAQDGQKFAAVLLLATSLVGREAGKTSAAILCGITMAVGTLLGGKRIIDKVGRKITALDEKSGICCDASSFVSMLLCTAFGIPVSTTHSKTTAVLGVGVSSGCVSLRAWGGIAFAWVLTFPFCFILSFVITKICI